eukprot:TRINITY_DN1354_c0_g1_i2.p1 TRINITY_DN1354_c0_g1~~TRINITY_DN1354_c0_g1_i2.p1  ORF type:complete len:100 (+),score=17.20 TRINITY_DN1354_c0_g1_i2:50-349(+)
MGRTAKKTTPSTKRKKYIRKQRMASSNISCPVRLANEVIHPYTKKIRELSRSNLPGTIPYGNTKAVLYGMYVMCFLRKYYPELLEKHFHEATQEASKFK